MSMDSTIRFRLPLGALIASTLIGSSILLFSSRAATQEPPPEPIAYIGHGGFFDHSGHQIPVTLSFVEGAQSWYKQTLVSSLTPGNKDAFATFEARLQKLSPAEGQARLIVQQRALEWLIANAPARAHDGRTLGKLRALKHALRWQLPETAEPVIAGSRVPFNLDPQLASKLDSQELTPPGSLQPNLATANSGQAYLDECAASGVPIPPTINVMDPNGLTGWKSQGMIPQTAQFIFGTPAEVRTYQSTSPEGMCYALPRYSDAALSTVALDGVICLGKQTSKACFWDNQMMGSAFTFAKGSQIPIGVPNTAVDPLGRYQAGGAELFNGSGGVCTDCHAGENPYIVHPDVDLGGGITWGSVENSLPAFSDNRYVPIVAAGWPQNQLSQSGPTAPTTCEGCHVKGMQGGRFPLLSKELPGYCAMILTKALAKTMPPDSPGTAVAAGTKFRDDWCNAPANAASADTGDPHLTTINGVHYDFQAAGEFVALKNSDNGFELQTRQSPVQTTFTPSVDPQTGLASCVSLNTAVALRLGTHRVTYEQGSPSQGNQMVFQIDGGPVTLPPTPIDLQNGYTVSTGSSVNELDVKGTDGTDLAVTPRFWTAQGYWYLDVDVHSTPAREGTMGPVLDGDWLPRGPDGSSYGGIPAALIDRHIVLNQTFANDWRVTSTTSLFDYGTSTSTSTYTDTNWPPSPGQACTTQLPSTPPLTQMWPDLANSVCGNINDNVQQANCVFDVTMTGDRVFAQRYQAPGSCHIGYTVASQWSTGFQATLSINNTGTTPISSWTLGWSFANGQTITQAWNAAEAQTGPSVMVNNLAYNANIPAGGSLTGVGFAGTWIGANSIPAAISLNGTSCSVN